MRSMTCSKPGLPWLLGMELGRVSAPAEDWGHSTGLFELPGVPLSVVHPSLQSEPHALPHTWKPQPDILSLEFPCATAHLGPAKVRERGWCGIQSFVKSNGPEENVQPHVCCCGGVLKRWSPEPKPPIWNKTKSVTAIKKGLKRAKLFQTCM